MVWAVAVTGTIGYLLFMVNGDSATQCGYFEKDVTSYWPDDSGVFPKLPRTGKYRAVAYHSSDEVETFGLVKTSESFLTNFKQNYLLNLVECAKPRIDPLCAKNNGPLEFWTPDPDKDCYEVTYKDGSTDKTWLFYLTSENDEFYFHYTGSRF